MGLKVVGAALGLLALGIMLAGCGGTEHSEDLASDVAKEWVDTERDRLAWVVTRAILEFPGVEEPMATLLRVIDISEWSLQDIVDERFDHYLHVSLNEVVSHGDALYSVKLLVSGTVNLENPGWPYETHEEFILLSAIDVSVPVVLTLDFYDEDQVTEWQADIPNSRVAFTFR